MKTQRRHLVFGLALQLLALSYLQLSGVASVLLRPSHSPVVAVTCKGNHADCGCPPERVASQTCCCYRHFAPCCVEARNLAPEEVDCHDEEASSAAQPRSPHTVSTAPCGTGTGTLGSNPERADFSRPDVPEVAEGEPRPEIHPCNASTPAHRCPEPPDPPPRASSLS